ncbi:MAG: cytochrome c biogenesis CcdA family protein [Sphingomonadaceae bacterium]
MADGLSPLLAFGAGALTILSPCVLPLVPIVLGSAAQQHRFGPLALATGLVASFTIVGFAVATLGASAGLDGENVRLFGAILLGLAGVFLLVPAAQAVLTRVATPLANWASQRQQGLERFGLAGQAAIGVLLGLVWSPCVGPTLGAATVLAAQGENLAQVAFVMFAFGLGIATVLVAIAFATRSVFTRWRGRMMAAGGGGKRVLGGLLLAVGIMIFTGLDRVVESAVVSASPAWLTELTTMI